MRITPDSRWLLMCLVALPSACGGRTAMVGGGEPVVTCSEREVDAELGDLVEVDGSATDDGAVVLAAWQLVERPEGSAAAAQSSSPSAATLTPDVEGDYALELTAVDDDGLSASCRVVVHATAPPVGPTVACPDPIVTTPLSSVALRSRVEDDGVIVAYEWSVLDAPDASAAPSPEPPDEIATVFVPDVVGEYTVRFTVTDDDGLQASCETAVSARPDGGLRVELYWNPPDRSCDTHPGEGCDGTDLDLHLLHPDAPAWFHLPLDCYYATCTDNPIDWPLEGADDDPLLALDDVEGFGPENINIPVPTPGFTYEVGVHFYSSDRSDLPATAYVTIYCQSTDAQPSYESGPVELMAPTEEDRDFWRVASVTSLGPDGCEIIPHVNDGGAPDIIPESAARVAR
jgi:hypothetical protein